MSRRELPAFVYLTDTVVMSGVNKSRPFLYAKRDSGASWTLYGEWELLSTDTIRLQLGDWSWGTNVLLPNAEGRVRGRARRYWDVVVPEMPQSEVTAEQVACSAAGVALTSTIFSPAA
jgi:hypothetical protein